MTDLLALKAKIEALSPEARLLLASQLMKKEPEMAISIVENVVAEYWAAKLFGPSRVTAPR